MNLSNLNLRRRIMPAQPLRVYLCDLTHLSILPSSDTIPINIGFLGAYARKIHKDDVAISLFKYPESVINAIRDIPPDVIALSNYSWNSNLSEHVAGLAKLANPRAITIQGGPNFSDRDALQLQFLRSRPNTDVYIEMEAEESFASLLGYILSARDDGRTLYDFESPGCVSIVPSTRRDLNPILRRCAKPNRIKDLDEIPSPYLNGMLDSFFDGRLVPFLETNRGCPFACTFCNTGNSYFNKINMFSIDRIKAEIEYVGRHIAGTGITHLYLADTNFGMYARDKEICDELARAQEMYAWPFHMYATTGKNNKERVVEITKVLGQALSVHMSVQSMDATVLKNIKRSNIRLDDYMQINKTLTARGQITRGEVIIGLPGETRESFARGIEELLDSEVSIITSYSLILLDGTPFKDPEYAGQYGITSKFRLVPLNFGEYAGTRIFDAEEAGVENRDMSFEDYLWMRGLSLMIETLYNSRPFLEFFKYARIHKVKPFAFVMKAYEAIRRAPEAVQMVFDGFMRETRGELWDSQEQLINHYREERNYKKLLAGEAGGNVINRYKGASLVFALDGWIDFLGQLCLECSAETVPATGHLQALREVSALKEYVRSKLAGLLMPLADEDIRRLKCDFDIPAWMQSSDMKPLAAFKIVPSAEYEFYFTREQLSVQRDMLHRYGSDLNGLSKIVTRVSSIETLFRHCRRALTETSAIAN